eukprot:scaffold100225_cov20-Tisochrysis_lutea.AAC.1
MHTGRQCPDANYHVKEVCNIVQSHQRFCKLVHMRLDADQLCLAAAVVACAESSLLAATAIDFEDRALLSGLLPGAASNTSALHLLVWKEVRTTCPPSSFNPIGIPFHDACRCSHRFLKHTNKIAVDRCQDRPEVDNSP